MIVRCHSCGSQNRLPPARLHQVARCGRCKHAVGPPSIPVALGEEAEFHELTESGSLPVLVDFWAEWCGPCRAVAPELEKLARAHAGRLVVAKVDTERLPSLAGTLQIRSIPTLALYRGGREVRRHSGALSASDLERVFEL